MRVPLALLLVATLAPTAGAALAPVELRLEPTPDFHALAREDVVRVDGEDFLRLGARLDLDGDGLVTASEIGLYAHASRRAFNLSPLATTIRLDERAPLRGDQVETPEGFEGGLAGRDAATTRYRVEYAFAPEPTNASHVLTLDLRALPPGETPRVVVRAPPGWEVAAVAHLDGERVVKRLPTRGAEVDLSDAGARVVRVTFVNLTLLGVVPTPEDASFAPAAAVEAASEPRRTPGLGPLLPLVLAAAALILRAFAGAPRRGGPGRP